jgi:hypothetical protein
MMNCDVYLDSGSTGARSRVLGMVDSNLEGERGASIDIRDTYGIRIE